VILYEFSGGKNMTAIFASLLEAAIKFLFFLFLAWGGIVCGKKYRDHKDAVNSGSATKETK
jgi:hypothetical protein